MEDFRLQIEGHAWRAGAPPERVKGLYDVFFRFFGAFSFASHPPRACARGLYSCAVSRR
jgi:hypothetical protein